MPSGRLATSLHGLPPTRCKSPRGQPHRRPVQIREPSRHLEILSTVASLLPASSWIPAVWRSATPWSARDDESDDALDLEWSRLLFSR